jgi:adenylate cyclase
LILAYVALEALKAAQRSGIAIDSTIGKVVMIAVFCLTFAAVFYGLVTRALGGGEKKRKKRQTRAKREMFEMPVAADSAVDEIPADEMPLLSPEMEKKLRHEAAQTAIQKVQALTEARHENKLEQESNGAKSEGSLVAEEAAQSLALQKTRGGLAGYSSSVLSSVAVSPETMDAYSRFGITLYMAGAAEKICNANELSQPHRQDALKGQFESLGHAPEVAEGFALNIDEYLTDQKYFRMYDLGRSAMGAHLENPDDAPTLVAALGDWNQPSPNQDAQDKGFVAVMFTDIGNSLAQGRGRGDDYAKEVLSEHNRIVRAALRQFGGDEVKHTGDGIMAVFSDVANALEAAIQVQADVSQFVQENDGQEIDGPGLQVRIGIHAGAGIREGGDHLGTPVLLAARVLDKAGAGEIVVSETVSEHCGGKEFGAEKIGDFELKGFKEAVPIYRVTYASNHKFS